MRTEPRTAATEVRLAYYRSEAARVRALALSTPRNGGREHFEQVARTYAMLAAWYAPEDAADASTLQAA